MAITDFRGEYRWLSNFHLVDIDWRGYVYRSTEHAYQSAKTDSPEEREKIRSAKTPGKAQRLGQKVTMRPHWDDEKIEVMRVLLRKKFFYPDLREKLLATGQQHLVEGNHWGDRFWGVCEGEGLNHLGRLLMDIREEIKEDVGPLGELAAQAE